MRALKLDQVCGGGGGSIVAPLDGCSCRRRQITFKAVGVDSSVAVCTAE